MNISLKSHSINAISGQAIKGFMAILLVLSVLVLAFLAAAGQFGYPSVTAQQFVNLQQGQKPFAGFRRAHAEGVCLSGRFESNGQLATYSKAAVFKPVSTSFIGRYSIAGNNPSAPDLKAPVRSLALALSANTSEQWRLAMNTPPVMAVATPEAFFQQLQALSPDPDTGQRNPDKIKTFFENHPESRAFNEWKAGYQATDSFATEQYHSINAFYLSDEEGHRQAVRWSAVPQATAQPDTTLNADNPDALFDEMKQRLQQDTIQYDLIFTLAESGDAVNNPTQPWPDSRQSINAGTVIITDWQPQLGGACDGINYNPLVLPEGIEPSQDPILLARSAAYAESLKRRAQEVFLGERSAGEQHE